MGAPVGNLNQSKGKPWQQALKLALSRKGGNLTKGLEAVADQVVKKAYEGDWTAIQEIANRVDGKPAQQQIVTGEDGGPVQIEEVNRPKLSKEEWLAAHGVGTPAGTAE